ncbi:MAG: Na/Pi cotransporter family protein [Lachnospiraceae bacterium]|nr:Na/Pi cotransporter family protein [Lachnospiraceae bacterium]
MDFFDVLSLLGGIALFLFGMTYMGDALKKLTGSQMRVILSKVTSNPLKGFLVGCAVTMIIQSSTATNVMILSFVNAQMLSLIQSIPLIIGANLGTTVTAWIISLSSIDGVSFVLKLLKPASFTPILIFVGVLLYRFSKKHKRQDIGAILIGFALLMYGMTTMSSSMSELGEMPQFTAIITALSNPLLSFIVGAVLAAVMQSSSASVGIVQALALAGDITYEVAIPMIIGINLGQVVPVMIASSGTSYDARRAAHINLALNLTGAIVTMPVYMILRGTGSLPFIASLATPVTLAITHTGYKLICSVWQLPARNLFEKASRIFVREPKDFKKALLDKRFLATPSLALSQCRMRTGECIKASVDSFKDGVSLLKDWNEDTAESVHEAEEMVDVYRDEIDSYLSTLSSSSLTDRESKELSYLIRVISDVENITDHIYHMVISIKKMWDSGSELSEAGMAQLQDLSAQTLGLLEISEELFYTGDKEVARKVVELEKKLVSDCSRYRESHLERLKKDASKVSIGTYFTDILLNFERIADHLSRDARMTAAE